MQLSNMEQSGWLRRHRKGDIPDRRNTVPASQGRAKALERQQSGSLTALPPLEQARLAQTLHITRLEGKGKELLSAAVYLHAALYYSHPCPSTPSRTLTRTRTSVLGPSPLYEYLPYLPLRVHWRANI